MVDGKALFLMMVPWASACAVPSFACDEHSECMTDVDAGRCELDGFCSFADPECPSGRRYAEHSDPERAGQCVARSPDGDIVDDSLGSEHLVRFGEHPLADVSSVTRQTYIVTGSRANHGGHYDMHVSMGSRGLLAFDLRAIPMTASVSSASLTLQVCESFRGGAMVLLRPLAEPWASGNLDGEVGAANWFDRKRGTPWRTPGAHDGGQPIARFETDSSGIRAVELPVDLVQGWVSDPSSNYGVLLSSTTASEIYIGGVGSEPSCRPLLEIRYRD